jgi:hypothetical protein
MITVPGLDVKSDWLPVHDLLIDEFRKVTDVLATTIPETLLIVYHGRADIDAWLGGVTEAVLVRRMRTAAVQGVAESPLTTSSEQRLRTPRPIRRLMH